MVSRPEVPYSDLAAVQFQSRNRGSFGFKGTLVVSIAENVVCFNLVIEVLLVSSILGGQKTSPVFSTSFNLVIEVLLVSSLSVLY